MTANSTIREWLRTQGVTVKDRGRISAEDQERYYAAHPSERGVRLLPGPDDDVDAWEDMGVIGPESDPEPFDGAGGTELPPEAPEPVSVDPEPAHAKREWRKPTSRERGMGAKRIEVVPVRVRKDINAKISLALEIPGRVWQARDPACGGAFVEQRPQISDALTEIVCQSPDLIAWFAGSGGQFMLWMNLAAACWPVATVIMAHHVYHTLEEGPVDAQQPDYGQYAA